MFRGEVVAELDAAGGLAAERRPAEEVDGDEQAVVVVDEADEAAEAAVRIAWLCLWLLFQQVPVVPGEDALQHVALVLTLMDRVAFAWVDDRFDAMPRLFLQEADRYWEFRLPNGLPTEDDPQKPIARSDEVLTQEFLEEYLPTATTGGR